MFGHGSKSGSRIPDRQIPDGRIPDRQVPDRRILDRQVPDRRIPDGRIPDGRIPDGGIPDHRRIPNYLRKVEKPALHKHLCKALIVRFFNYNQYSVHVISRRFTFSFCQSAR